MADRFTSVSLENIIVGEPLPVALYLFIDFRFITFRAQGDSIDRLAYERLEFKHVTNLFVRDEEYETYIAWKNKLVPRPSNAPEFQNLAKTKKDAHRKMLDIFQSNHPDRMIKQALDTAKKLTQEVMKLPVAAATIPQLQTYSPGIVNHSINVSVLSIYLASQMGYSSQAILTNIGTGALLHDLGKIKVRITDLDMPPAVEEKLKEHPLLGAKMLEQSGLSVPQEVIYIVAQHHEYYDGTGYPQGLRGNNIYDLARIVVIANLFDEYVADGQGSIQERQQNALRHIDQVLYAKFDPEKHEKAIRILKYGI